MLIKKKKVIKLIYIIIINFETFLIQYKYSFLKYGILYKNKINVYYLSFIFYYLLFIFYYLLFIIYYLSFIFYYLLFIIYYLSFIFYYFLFFIFDFKFGLYNQFEKIERERTNNYSFIFNFSMHLFIKKSYEI